MKSLGGGQVVDLGWSGTIVEGSWAERSRRFEFRKIYPGAQTGTRVAHAGGVAPLEDAEVRASPSTISVKPSMSFESMSP